MTRAVFVILLLVVAGAGVWAAATLERPTATAVAVEEADPPARMPGQVEFNRTCQGRVLELKGDVITLRTLDYGYHGWTASRLLPDEPGVVVYTGNPVSITSWPDRKELHGTELRVAREEITLTTATGGTTTIRLADQPARPFVAGLAFADGAYPKGERASKSYRPADVRVGDWISLDYARVDGIDIYSAICIWRRPGGIVPVAPKDIFGAPPTGAWHELVNAFQDWEERGIPLPAKYARYGPGLNPPYPPRAPMPREVKR